MGLVVTITHFIPLLHQAPNFDVDMWENVIQYEKSISDLNQKTKITVNADFWDKKEFFWKDEDNADFNNYLTNNDWLGQNGEVKIQEFRANKSLDSSEIYNKNSFFIDFNIVPLEDFDSFNLYFQDKWNNFTTGSDTPSVIVSMKEYQVGENGGKIKDLLKEQKELSDNKNIVGFSDNNVSKRYSLSSKQLFIPEKNLSLDTALKVNNFYDVRFKKGKIYKIRIMLLLWTTASWTSPDFPIIVGANENTSFLKDTYTSDIKEFLTSNSIQLIQSNVNNKKFDMHNVRVYNKWFINKIGEIKY